MSIELEWIIKNRLYMSMRKQRIIQYYELSIQGTLDKNLPNWIPAPPVFVGEYISLYM